MPPREVICVSSAQKAAYGPARFETARSTAAQPIYDTSRTAFTACRRASILSAGQRAGHQTTPGVRGDPRTRCWWSQLRCPRTQSFPPASLSCAGAQAYARYPGGGKQLVTQSASGKLTGSQEALTDHHYIAACARRSAPPYRQCVGDAQRHPMDDVGRVSNQEGSWARTRRGAREETTKLKDVRD